MIEEIEFAQLQSILWANVDKGQSAGSKIGLRCVSKTRE